jgi:ubiquinone/menaquinone biosynthesis C-methylase UbiE
MTRLRKASQSVNLVSSLKVVWPTSLYSFLKLIERVELEKKVLDCGAGGPKPPLALFYSHGYEVHGIDISESAIIASEKFSEEHDLKLNIIKGDMRKIPFDDASFSFVFSQNSICHLTKTDTAKAIREMVRVLRPGGYLFVDFMSSDSSYCGSPTLGEEVGPGEYQYIDDDGDKILHCFHSDGEPDKYFTELKIVRIVKTTSQNLSRKVLDVDVRLDYYAIKPIQ